MPPKATAGPELAPADPENNNGVAGDPGDSQGDFEEVPDDDDQPITAKKGKGIGKSPKKNAPAKKAAPAAKKKPTVTKKATITIIHDTPKELAAFRAQEAGLGILEGLPLDEQAVRLSARAVGVSSDRLRLDTLALKASLLNSHASASVATVLMSSSRVTAGVDSQVLKGLQDKVASIQQRRESLLQEIEQMALEDREDAGKAVRVGQAIADADAEETELSEGEDEEEYSKQRQKDECKVDETNQ
ncbi:hypothetical protein B9479_005348 [Cryptococcus floricola]|uniref:Uncharacterized protein n=1 Tax=Cryptococcus floricola TaxID=2591691 RepID=A0A5D3ATL5_9TREE|nr:hypothetical protein B9479_005348 [Cryptococcus floricola]